MSITVDDINRLRFHFGYRLHWIPKRFLWKMIPISKESLWSSYPFHRTSCSSSFLRFITIEKVTVEIDSWNRWDWKFFFFFCFRSNWLIKSCYEPQSAQLTVVNVFLRPRCRRHGNARRRNRPVVVVDWIRFHFNSIIEKKRWATFFLSSFSLCVCVCVCVWWAGP